MKKLILFLLITLIHSQTSTEIYLFDLGKVNGQYTLTNSVNISNNIGYDNQPSFMRNGRQILFASTRNGQTDIVSYNIRTQKKTWLTNTEGGEYSPLQIGKSNTFSAIRLDPDGYQRLYKYSMYSGRSEELVKDLKIGYHGWVGRDALVSFVLGNPPTLQKSDLRLGTNTILDSRIGRSILKMPGSDQVAYISKKQEPWAINTLNLETGKIQMLIPTLKGSEDFTLNPSGNFIMGQGTKIFIFDSELHSNWMQISDLSTFGLEGVSRLAVSPKGEKIVMVVKGK